MVYAYYALAKRHELISSTNFKYNEMYNRTWNYLYLQINMRDGKIFLPFLWLFLHLVTFESGNRDQNHEKHDEQSCSQMPFHYDTNLMRLLLNSATRNNYRCRVSTLSPCGSFTHKSTTRNSGRKKERETKKTR